MLELDHIFSHYPLPTEGRMAVNRTQHAFYEALLADDEQAYRQLYKLVHQRTARYLAEGGGTRDEIRAVIHETIVALLFNIRYNRYEWREEADLMTYLVRIARTQWAVYCRDRGRTDRFPDELDLHDIPTSDELTEESFFEQRRQSLLRAMSLLDEGCRHLLELYYYQRQSMRAISDQLQMPSEDAVKARKYRCMTKLKKLINPPSA